MRSRNVLSLTLALMIASAASVFAMSGGSPPPTPPPSSSPTPVPGSSGGGSAPSTTRGEAEQAYALAYEEVGKANKDIEDGKAKNAEKKFRRALERCENAVALDDRYHEAWNLIGYTSRKLDDYDKAFKAYQKCLAIKWDYAPAREYLGEAWLEKGDVKKAREQLVMLEQIEAETEHKALKDKIDAYLVAHPEAAAAAPTPTETAKADSTSGSPH